MAAPTLVFMDVLVPGTCPWPKRACIQIEDFTRARGWGDVTPGFLLVRSGTRLTAGSRCKSLATTRVAAHPLWRLEKKRSTQWASLPCAFLQP